MKSQTARKPDHQRSARSNKSKNYIKQTAHVEARRDGKPLIFGWGAHLSVREKNQIKQRAVWVTTIFIALIILFTIVAFWININVITPNRAITTVNGQAIPQSDYRKLLALKAQIEQNNLKGPNGLNAQSDQLRKQVAEQQSVVDNLNKKIEGLNNDLKKEPAGTPKHDDLQKQLTQAQNDLKTANTKLTDLGNQYNEMQTNTIPLAQQRYVQSSLGSETAQWLQDDALIRQWLAGPGKVARSQVEPTSKAITDAINKFKANLPKSSSYDKFLSNDHVSNDDVQVMMALLVRRDNMQTYLANQITSPTRQVKARGITVATQKDADALLKQLQKSDADFAKLAKDKSSDSSTKDKGGEFGWMARGQYLQTYAANAQAIIDNWIFDPSRKVNELSPVLYENGTYHIIQITDINPSRDVDKDTLNALKVNALNAWMLEQKALPTTKVGDIDQTMLTDPNIMPPDLPQSAPAQPTPAGGLPTG
ncbi:MAG: peptidylprolyl isomerase [Ktedonobacteraceae bacterium]|nr:peptidylprolyl isomerase [Ktedonobacteraceae bacterium]MBO0792582.1 peptidylprolyl isomerase [Ktedonobacteraceae bacterium]